jgi:sulfofructose kinase
MTAKNRESSQHLRVPIISSLALESVYNWSMIVTGLGQCSLDYLAVVDVYPAADTKKEVLQWNEQGGGPVATALVALSRLGIKCRFYGVVGDDDAGQKIRQSLIDEGVDVSGLVARTNASSQIAFIAVEKGTAKRTIFWKRPTGEFLNPGELPGDFLAGSYFLLLDGLMKDCSLCAAERARARGIPVMLDAGRMHPGMIEIARLSDYLVASAEFAKDNGWSMDGAVLLGERERLGVRALTVTKGEHGSITAFEGGFFDTPAFQVEAVDTTGAGDVFHGGYIYGLLHGWPLDRTVRFASAMAALKCLKIGGRTGIPELSEVEKFLRER